MCFPGTELTKPLPANSPEIWLLSTGYCKSQLTRRYSPLLLRILSSIPEVLLARTTEEGSRQLLSPAAIGGAGHEFELRGAYAGKATLQEVDDYVLRDELRRRYAVSASLGGCASRYRIMGYIIENKIQDESVEIFFSLATLQVCSAL